MELHEVRPRPAPWSEARRNVKHKWALPFAALEWCLEWLAYRLANWKFLHVVNYLRSFGIIVAVAFYFSESGDRLKQKHYQAWQVINTAQGKGGNGGRLDALQELDCRGASFRGATLDDGDFSGADLSNADFSGATLASSDLRNADLRGINWTHIVSVKGANIARIRNAPEGFVAWALKNGAVQNAPENR